MKTVVYFCITKRQLCIYLNFSVDGTDLKNASHDEAVKVLKGTKQNVNMQVRYMKEVTPYFHKAMLLGDFGWEPPPTAFLAQVSSSNPNVNSNVPVAPSTSSSSSSMIPPEFTSPNSEMKWTSLQLTCLTKDANFPEENASTLEIHSPNRKNSILLRVSTKSVDRWSSAISAAIDQVRYLPCITAPPPIIY